MPYIQQEDRKHFKDAIAALSEDIGTPGDLNYVITELIHNYIGDDLSYSKINAMIGVLECAKLEFYRRVAAKYEDKKIAENGDVGILNN